MSDRGMRAVVLLALLAAVAWLLVACQGEVVKPEEPVAPDGIVPVGPVDGWPVDPGDVNFGEQEERICVWCRGESRYYFGGDIKFYSDEMSTQTLHLDGGTGNIDSEGDGDFADDLVVGDDATFTDAVAVGGTLTLNDGAILDTQSGTSEGVVFAQYITTTYSVTTTGVVTVPANADVIDWALIVTTAYNDSGTEVMNCGTASDGDMFVDDLDLTAGRNMALDAADMQSDESTWGDVGSSDIGVLCVFTGQNGNASAGAGVFILWWRVDE